LRRFVFDTGVFVYALGGEHPYRDPCRAIVSAQGSGALTGEVSVELIHEFAYVRVRRAASRSDAIRAAREITEMCTLQQVTSHDMQRALDLWGEHQSLDVRDAIFAAQALNRGIDAILSPDHGFDGVDGLERIDPADAHALATLR
jgi:predicted nucleic acid-binding protein